MKLPPRVYYTLMEAAARWSCRRADIAAWSIAGELTISTPIPPVTCGETVVAGLVQIAAGDVFPMFRHGPGAPTSAMVRRIRPLDPPDADWRFITEPEEGLRVEAEDLVITAAEVTRFEDAHEIFRRAVPGSGPDFKYGWVEMLQWLAVRIHEHGVPDNQQALIDACRQWFIDRSPDGEHPTDRSIRRYITPVWKELRRNEYA